MWCGTAWSATSSGPTPRTRRADMKLPTQDQVRYHGARWAWVLALAVVANVAFPSSAADVAPLLEPGARTAREIIAPFNFVVNKSEDELQREAEELAPSAKPLDQFPQRDAGPNPSAADPFLPVGFRSHARPPHSSA